jgi:hypothetical protein
MPTLDEEIEHYLLTGDCDVVACVGVGSLREHGRTYAAALREALIDEVRDRSAGTALASLPGLPADFAPVPFARNKATPMVHGLFPRSEQEIVLATLERSVVFLTPENIEDILRDTPWPHTAWSLANLYLESLGRKPLGPDDSRVVGLGEELQCFVSPVYFAMDDRFADYVVHELAHVFHNCKREIFAYACEAYGRILELADRPPARANLLDEHARGPLPSREEVDRAEYFDILHEAVPARNGWKRIYERCRRSRPPRRVRGLTMDGRND